MNTLVQVAAFSNEIEMSLMRNKIENIGIETFIKDEHVNALKEFSVGGINGVKILVKQEDYARTINYLIEIRHYTINDFKPSWLERILQKYLG